MAEIGKLEERYADLLEGADPALRRLVRALDAAYTRPQPPPSLAASLAHLAHERRRPHRTPAGDCGEPVRRSPVAAGQLRRTGARVAAWATWLTRAPGARATAAALRV